MNTAFFHPFGATGEHKPRQEANLVYVGLLETRKGVDDLLPIFARVNIEIPTAQLTIVGTGPRETELRRLCRGLGLSDRVDFRSSLGDEELAGILGNCNVFLFPSRLEGFGLAAAEAMACGRPVVAYDNATNREVIGDAGVLVPEGDLHEFSASVINLILNPSLASEFGDRGRRRVVGRFSWQSAAHHYIELANELMTGT